MPTLPARRCATTAATWLPLVLIASGCAYLSGGGADPESAQCAPFRQWQETGGGTVTVYASIRGEEGQRTQRAWQRFTECTGIDTAYEGSGEFEAQVQVKVDGGNAPDIAFFPQPGLLHRFVDSGDALPLPDPVRERTRQGWDGEWFSY